MYKIPLSVSPIDHVALNEILLRYSEVPSMKLVDDFEAKVREYTGSKYVLALNSGTAAIHLALKALGVSPGDVVIAPTFTYVATLNPILYLGAEPILIDSETTTWNLDPEQLEFAIEENLKKKIKPRCVIVVHSYGMPAQMDEIRSVCSKYEIPILEDAAEAIGSRYKGVLAGTMGEVGIFSFNNNKIVTTYGGGALLTENEEIFKKALFWSSQSRENKPFYEHTDIGFNYRMGPLNAAAGLVGFKDIARKIETRRMIYETYKNDLKELGSWEWPEPPAIYYSNRWLTTPLSNDLKINDITGKMDQAGIECRRLWNPMHLQPFFRKYPSFRTGVAEGLFEHGICLPSSNLEAISAVKNGLLQAIV